MKTTPDRPEVPGAAEEQRRLRQSERRRLLLKGLGKGSAMVAAATPLESLATGRVLTGNKMLCTASGMQSVVRSQTTSGEIYCGGFGHTKYKKQWISGKWHWPGWPAYDSSTGHSSFTCGIKTISTSSASCTFAYVFGSGSSSKLIDILEAGDSSERVWITAFLNSEHHRRTPSYGMNFPYSPAVILSLWSSSQKASAETLFRNHLMQK